MELDGEGENVMKMTMMRMKMVVCKELCRSGRVEEWKRKRKREEMGGQTQPQARTARDWLPYFSVQPGV